MGTSSFIYFWFCWKSVYIPRWDGFLLYVILKNVCVCVLHEYVSLFSLHRVLLIHFNEHSVSHMCFSFQISMWFCCCFCFFHLPTYTYIASHSLPHTPYPFNVEWDVRRQQYRCLLLVLNKEGTCCDAMRNTQLEFANFCFAAYLFAGSFAALFLCVMLPTQYNHYFSAVSFLIYCSLSFCRSISCTFLCLFLMLNIIDSRFWCSFDEWLLSAKFAYQKASHPSSLSWLFMSFL